MLGSVLSGLQIMALYQNPNVPGGSWVKNQPANAGDTGSIPGLERSPREGNGNLGILAREIPWTEDPGGLQ